MRCNHPFTLSETSEILISVRRVFDLSPRPGNLDEYRDVLEGLNASVAFKAMGDYRDPVSIYDGPIATSVNARDHPIKVRLFGTCVKKLSQLYNKHCRQGFFRIPTARSRVQVSSIPH